MFILLLAVNKGGGEGGELLKDYFSPPTFLSVFQIEVYRMGFS